MITVLSLIHVSAKESNDNFYIAGEASLGVINRVSIAKVLYEYIKNTMPEGYEMKFLKGLAGNIGVGYRINNFRADAKVGYCFTHHKYYSNYTFYKAAIEDRGSPYGIKESINYYSKDIKIKMRDLDISINTYYDFPVKFKNIRPFVLGGYGISNKKIEFVKDAIFVAKNPIDMNEIYRKSREREILSYKNKKSPFYILGLGISCDIDPLNLDFIYKYKKNLKDANYKNKGGYNFKMKSRTHYFTLGVRYNF